MVDDGASQQTVGGDGIVVHVSPGEYALLLAARAALSPARGDQIQVRLSRSAFDALVAARVALAAAQWKEHGLPGRRDPADRAAA